MNNTELSVMGGGSDTAIDAKAETLKTLNFFNERLNDGVVETWESGTNWYRKYSDGWIEQGGYIEADIPTFGDGPHVNFHKPFSSTNYTPLIVSAEDGIPRIVKKTTSYFTTNSFYNPVKRAYWVTFGY